jgi:hypothetical protein
MKGVSMRSAFALASLTFAAACGSDGGGGDGVDGGNGGDGGLQPPARGFQVVTPDVVVQPGPAGETTYCYYFRTSNTEMLSIKRWQSEWTAGSHHVILYFTSSLSQPEGTMRESSCGFSGGGLNVPQWIYSAQNSPSDLTLPPDDGTGTPVGMDVAPGQAAMLEVHYLNSTDDPITSKVTVNAEAYDAGVATTKTFAYITYDGRIRIPANATGHTESVSCDIPAGGKVWLMSTHAHKRATRTRVLDGNANSTSVVFQSTDWEHPGVEKWMTAPFYSFSTGRLTSECTWNNPTNTQISDGSSAATEEMCMAAGYIFPATKPTICYGAGAGAADNGTTF